MQANDIKFAVAPVMGGKQLIGTFDGVFENDTQIAEYFRDQAEALMGYADRLDEIEEERRKRLEGAKVGSV